MVTSNVVLNVMVQKKRTERQHVPNVMVVEKRLCHAELVVGKAKYGWMIKTQHIS